MPFFISINYFTMLGTGWVNKVFSLGTFINIYLKNGNKHETNVPAFTNVTFRHNSACVRLTSDQDLKGLSQSD